MEEETTKLLPLPKEYSGDDIESLCYDISNIMYDINEHEESVLDSNPNDPPQFPKWVKRLSHLSVPTLEILLSQEEPEQTFKE